MRYRVNKEEALHLLQQAPLLEVTKRAHDIRMAMHPEMAVSFVVDTNPNYTNICKTACSFCSFYRPIGHNEGYVLSAEQLVYKVKQAQAQGATTLLLQGGHHPDLPLDYYLQLIRALQQECPDIHLHLLSPTEIAHIAAVEQCSIETVFDELRALGLTTMPGGGAEILNDTVRKIISPNKTTADEWLAVSRLAHEKGMITTATMTYGHVEKPEHIIEHLFRLRDLQDITGGFSAFIPWSMKPASSVLSKKVPVSATPALYLRIIALARIVLDNFPHIQASWFSEGKTTGQLALYAGADDFGGVIIEENVLFQARHALASTPANVVSMIEQAGFTARQRTTRYDYLPGFTFNNPQNSDDIIVRSTVNANI